MTYDTIERDGVRLVLVPETDFARLKEAVEDLADVQAYDRAKSTPPDYLPAALVARLVAGENPLKVWREHRSLTQQQLADAAGVSKPYVSQIEAGARDPTLATLKALAAVLAIAVDDLI